MRTSKVTNSLLVWPNLKVPLMRKSWSRMWTQVMFKKSSRWILKTISIRLKKIIKCLQAKRWIKATNWNNWRLRIHLWPIFLLKFLTTTLLQEQILVRNQAIHPEKVIINRDRSMQRQVLSKLGDLGAQQDRVATLSLAEAVKTKDSQFTRLIKLADQKLTTWGNLSIKEALKSMIQPQRYRA